VRRSRSTAFTPRDRAGTSLARRSPHRPALRAAPTGDACPQAAPWPRRSQGRLGGRRRAWPTGGSPWPPSINCALSQAPGLRLGHVAAAGEITEELRKVLVVGLLRGPLGSAPFKRLGIGIASREHHVRLRSPFLGEANPRRALCGPQPGVQQFRHCFPTSLVRDAPRRLTRASISESGICWIVLPRRSAKSHSA
jgi:hypothetical protein